MLSGIKYETVKVGAIDLADTNGGMCTMDIRNVNTVVVVDLVSIVNLVEKIVANVNENWWAHEVKIIGGDEFHDGDTRSTLQTIIINKELKFGVEIGANTTTKVGR